MSREPEPPPEDQAFRQMRDEIWRLEGLIIDLEDAIAAEQRELAAAEDQVRALRSEYGRRLAEQSARLRGRDER